MVGEDSPRDTDLTEIDQSAHEFDFPGVNPVEEVTEEFNLDIGAVSTVQCHPFNFDRPVYHRYKELSVPEQRQLDAYLRGKYRDGTDRLFDYFEQWKESSAPRMVTQSYERLVQDTFDVAASVRGNPAITRLSTQQERNALRDYRRASVAFLSAAYGDELPACRGLRHNAPAELFLQAVDDPERSTFYLKTNAVSNFLAFEELAKKYSKGITIKTTLSRTDILAAVDQLRPSTYPREAEYHVRGGTFSIPEQCVRITGFPDDDDALPSGDRELTTVAAKLENPSSLSLPAHGDVFDLLGYTAERGYRVGTEQGHKRLREWAEYARSYYPMNQYDEESFNSLIEAVATVDNDAYWV